MWPLSGRGRCAAQKLMGGLGIDAAETLLLERIFDATRSAARYWEYYSAMVVSFFITEDVLRQVQPDMRCDEAAQSESDSSRRDEGLCVRPSGLI